VGSIYHHFGGKQGLAGAVFVMTLSSPALSPTIRWGGVLRS
jgi:AcrR family transcriptional regulator